MGSMALPNLNVQSDGSRVDRHSTSTAGVAGAYSGALSYKDMLSSFMNDGEENQSENKGENNKSAVGGSAKLQASGSNDSMSMLNALSLKTTDFPMANIILGGQEAQIASENEVASMENGFYTTSEIEIDENGTVTLVEKNHYGPGWKACRGEIDTRNQVEDVVINKNKTIDALATDLVKYSNNLDADQPVITKMTQGGVEVTSATASSDKPVFMTMSNGRMYVNTQGSFAVGNSMPITTTVTVYDGDGEKYSVPVYLTKTGNGEWMASINSDVTKSQADILRYDETPVTFKMEPTKFTFDENGNINKSNNSSAFISYKTESGMHVVLLDLSGVTQQAGKNSINATSNGYAGGYLEELTVNQNGEIIGKYSNGVSVVEGKIDIEKNGLKDEITENNLVTENDKEIEITNEKISKNDYMLQTIISFDKNGKVITKKVQTVDIEDNRRYIFGDDEIALKEKKGNDHIIMGKDDEFIKRETDIHYEDETVRKFSKLYDYIDAEKYAFDIAQELIISNSDYEREVFLSDPYVVYDCEGENRKPIMYVRPRENIWSLSYIGRDDFGNIRIRKDFSSDAVIAGDNIVYSGTGSVNVSGSHNKIEAKVGPVIVYGNENEIITDCVNCVVYGEDNTVVVNDSDLTSVLVRSNNCTVEYNGSTSENLNLSLADKIYDLKQNVSFYDFIEDNGDVLIKSQNGDRTIKVKGNDIKNISVIIDEDGAVMKLSELINISNESTNNGEVIIPPDTGEDLDESVQKINPDPFKETTKEILGIPDDEELYNFPASRDSESYTTTGNMNITNIHTSEVENGKMKIDMDVYNKSGVPGVLEVLDDEGNVVEHIWLSEYNILPTSAFDFILSAFNQTIDNFIDIAQLIRGKNDVEYDNASESKWTKIRGLEIPAGTHVRITNSINQSDELRAYYVAATLYDSVTSLFKQVDFVVGNDIGDDEFKWAFKEVVKNYIKESSTGFIDKTIENQVKHVIEKIQTNPSDFINDIGNVFVEGLPESIVRTAVNAVSKIAATAIHPALEKAVGTAFDIADMLNLSRMTKDAEKYSSAKPIHYYFYGSQEGSSLRE